MPSVEMRRTTRVFGVVKGADGARALRSGRRLWPDSGEGKESRSGSYGEEWYDTLANGDSGDACKKDGWVPSIKSMEGVAFTEIDNHGAEVPETMNSLEVPDDQGAVDRRWGLVYTRKKTIKRYARQFTRRQKRRKNNSGSSVLVVDSGDNRLDFTGQVVALDGFALGPVLVLHESSSMMGCFACMLNLVLRYMKRARVRLSELSAFLSTEPIDPVYSSHGIRFMQDLPSTPTSGICKIYQASQLTPMFTVDFSAIPGCFMYMHLSMFLQNQRLSFPLVMSYSLLNNLMTVQTIGMYDDEEPSSRLPSERRIISEAGHLVNRAVLHPSVRDSELAGCTAQYSDGLNLGGYQKKRSSIPRKSRTPCPIYNVLLPLADKTIPVPGVLEVSDKTIPVPGVREVSDYGDSNVDTFLRPDSYIRLNNNEAERALSKRTNYDMDSDDEEWLDKFNIGLFGEDRRAEYISVDRFESMVDEFEKALFRSPDDKFDENAAINHCLGLGLGLGERKVVEKVCKYWTKKRELKRSALLRVFQLHQQKSASHVPRPGLRKRRSSKRQPSQSGRGKQPSVLLAIAAEQDALQEAEKAKAHLMKCEEKAVARRQRAQSLAESADLAVYKAAMAVQVAEAAELVGSTSISCDKILDECDKDS